LDARCLWPSAVNNLPAGQPPVTPRPTQNSLAPGDPVLHLRELGYPRERQGYPTAGRDRHAFRVFWVIGAVRVLGECRDLWPETSQQAGMAAIEWNCSWSAWSSV